MVLLLGNLDMLSLCLFLFVGQLVGSLFGLLFPHAMLRELFLKFGYGCFQFHQFLLECF
jgi:hypothetical protein